MFSPNIYWSVFLDIGGTFLLIFIFVVYPLAYFILGRSFDRNFKRIGEGFFEEGIPLFSLGFRVIGFAWDIVLQPYRHKKIKNRLAERFVKGHFQHQEKIYGKVDFRKDASRFQVVLAYLLTYGMIFIGVYAALYLFHDLILFREFTQVKRG